MKVCALFVLCMGLSAVMCASMDKRVAELHRTCVAESGVDEALIEKANAEKVLEDDQKLKCYIMCIMKHSGSMSDDGTVDVEAIVANLPDEIKNNGASVVRACGTKVGANPCENAWLTHKCYLQTGPNVRCPPYN
ncbi:general odorant-binding protein 69a-like [Anoplophora glabripennis]|uniref:general odorant-binding protein 69a-like n=1 Tax=Anoplophora glabripennis TaxID=217634 RepID=UPI0008759501|nr:general odorant-binding protein 69a-like [Anoplophora glabripennis]